MKIATIDFDIIMAPSIEYYNDSVKTDEPASDLIEKFSFLRNLPADMYIYQYLTQFILDSYEKEIIFIEDHSEIVNYIKNFTSPIEEIINIDHHHDLGYDINRKFPLLNNYDCGSWAKYLLDKKLIQNYTWICDENSSEIPKEKNTKRILLKNFNLDKLVKEIDYLVICKSPEWVPVEYWPLYDVWQNIVDLYKKI